MTKKEAKIKALEYILNCNYAYAELHNDFEQYTSSQFDKITNEVEYETNIIQNKLTKLRNEIYK